METYAKLDTQTPKPTVSTQIQIMIAKIETCKSLAIDNNAKIDEHLSTLLGVIPPREDGQASSAAGELGYLITLIDELYYALEYGEELANRVREI